jgi:hypothetical protein
VWRSHTFSVFFRPFRPFRRAIVFADTAGIPLSHEKGKKDKKKRQKLHFIYLVRNIRKIRKKTEAALHISRRKERKQQKLVGKNNNE